MKFTRLTIIKISNLNISLIQYSIAFISIITAFSFVSVYSSDIEKPNIIWIIGEDMGPDLGCWGVNVHTPNIDKLAKQGVRYTNIYGTASVCMPNRTAMATGVTQTTIGSVTMRPPKQFQPKLPEGVKPIPALMRELGYFTANIKNDDWGCIGKDDWNFKYDEQKWDTKKLSDIESKTPFYAQFNFFMAHRPFRQDEEKPIDPEKLELPPYYPDHPVSRQSWSDYLESIQHLDRGVGKVLQWLEEKKLADNTIIFFFSDNGEPFLRAKYFLYDCSLNQPLIVKWPINCNPPKSFKPGSANDRLQAAIDITAQTLICAGGFIPDWMHGQQFIGNNIPERNDIFSAADWYGDSQLKSRSLRTKHFKYIKNYNTSISVNSASTQYRILMHPMYHLINILAERNELSDLHRELLYNPLPAEELYDLKNDPHELNNLVKDKKYSKMKNKFSKKLQNRIKETGDKGFEPLDPEHIKHFADYKSNSITKHKKKQDALYEEILSIVENHSNSDR